MEKLKQFKLLPLIIIIFMISIGLGCDKKESAPNPQITSISPNLAKIGENITVNVTGAGFKRETTVSLGSGITVSDATYVNTTSLEVNIEVSGSATAGKRDVVVTNPGGEVVTGTSMFEVVQDLNADGFLLYCDYGNGAITKLRISDESIIKTWELSYGDPASLQGLDFDAGNLWLSCGGSSDQIFKLNPNDLTELSNIDAPPAQTGTVRGIAFDGTGNMWAANSSTPGAIYKLNKENGTMLDTIAGPVSGNDIRGIVFANGVLYANDKQEDKVYSYNFTSETWTKVFDVPVPGSVPSNRVFPVGMTWDGTNFWIVNSSYEHDYLLKVSPTGTLLKSILVEQGAAANAIKLSGIVFTAN